MKWLLVTLVLSNVCYLAWELNKQTSINIDNSVKPLTPPAEARRLKILQEDNKESILKTEPTTDNHQNNSLSMQQDNISIKEKISHELNENITKFSSSYVWGTKNKQLQCTSFGPFSNIDETAALNEWLEKNNIEAKQRAVTNEKNQYFWVYLAPNQSENEAIATAKKLTDQDITDHRIINTGNLQNAISLGLFSSEQSANKRLNELRRIGYQPIVVPYHKEESIIWIDANITQNRLNTLYKSGDKQLLQFNSILAACGTAF